MKLTVIIGYPNAGKTTYSQRFENVVHYDDHRHISVEHAYRETNEAVKALLLDGKDVCLDTVHNRRKRRVDLLETIKDVPCEKHLIWLDTPLETCIAREVRHRPEALIKANAVEAPIYDEGWDTITIIREEK